MKLDHVLEGSGGEITACERETPPPSYIVPSGWKYETFCLVHFPPKQSQLLVKVANKLNHVMSPYKVRECTVQPQLQV